MTISDLQIFKATPCKHSQHQITPVSTKLERQPSEEAAKGAIRELTEVKSEEDHGLLPFGTLPYFSNP